MKDFDPYKKIDNVRKAVKKYNNSDKGKDRKRKSYLQRTYNLSIDDYNKKLKDQSHKCAICGIDETELTSNLHVDHNHTTGTIRELLCTNCNLGIGMFKENIDSLAKAISYLEKHKEKP